MGQELACKMRYQGQSFAGKAHLETDFVLFRGETRLRVAFRDLTGVVASGGDLRLAFGGEEAVLELGAAAAKWADRILHPPSRMDKLGVKAGTTVALVGEFEEEFGEELRLRGAVLMAGRGAAELVFFAAEKTGDLGRVARLTGRVRGALWVVYPKGVAAIREVEVIEAGRAAGLRDSKVAAFSGTRTALRFSRPADKR